MERGGGMHALDMFGLERSCRGRRLGLRGGRSHRRTLTTLEGLERVNSADLRVILRGAAPELSSERLSGEAA